MQKKMEQQYQKKTQSQYYRYEKRWQTRAELDHAIRNLNYHMRKTYYDYMKERNLEEFDRMLDGYER